MTRVHRRDCHCDACPEGRWWQDRKRRAYGFLGLIGDAIRPADGRPLDGLRYLAPMVDFLQWRQTVDEVMERA